MYYIHLTQIYCSILWIYRVITCDENVIRNSGIAELVYRFDPPSRCNIVRLNPYRSFCFFLLDIFFSFDGRGKISKKRKSAAAGYLYYNFSIKSILKNYDPPLKNLKKNCDPPQTRGKKIMALPPR